MFCEIGRILSHILNVTTQAMDVGALTPTLWGFEEREKLMGFYERVSGSRLHSAYFRPGGVHRDLPDGIEEDIKNFCEIFPKHIDDLEKLKDPFNQSGLSEIDTRKISETQNSSIFTRCKIIC